MCIDIWQHLLIGNSNDNMLHFASKIPQNLLLVIINIITYVVVVRQHQSVE